ncbi:hypothetical protein M9H77_17060 [Catharanthus roseus]|uniref:Uncharacterized protein n=1 Tax=Catharanthus roseus TaxID=4058 RepID=A0ACC0B3P2_CATRO|nr:hypothetical protein M9H77_17060 [Catharanthus roseus]
MLGSVTLDLDPVYRGRSTVEGLGPRRYCVLLCIMLCGTGYFLVGWFRRGPPARVAQGGLVNYGLSDLKPIAALQAELARTNRHFHLSPNRLAAEVAQIRGTPEVQRHGTSLQCRIETTSRSANETSAEAEALRRNFSRLWDVTCKL